MKQETKNARTETWAGQAWQMGEGAMQLAANLFHAGMGCVATTEKQTRELFDRLVQKGKHYENDDERWFARATHEVEDLGQRLESGTRKTIDATLRRTGIPSRDEIRKLSHSVEELARKVDGLSTRGTRQRA